LQFQWQVTSPKNCKFARGQKVVPWYKPLSQDPEDCRRESLLGAAHPPVLVKFWGNTDSTGMPW
jgi:hypothetical protein